MARYHAERPVPFSADQMFDLVADVERYPEFVPWWTAARVTHTTPTLYHTTQSMGLGPVHLTFASETHLRRPERIHVTATGGGVRTLVLTWQFTPRPQGCLTRLDMTLEMTSPALDLLVGRLSREAARTLVEAFERRARAVYPRHGRLARPGLTRP
ncbi:type II toxin-antitoxin system RatA family toxin [Pararhodospirillum photometricum]|uniref:Cyclase/dehydrase n=1 Tax=Pararhodospirillum photometricum DSM 122 TaxID=1150469 RepID=H6SN29_PARPM|nr:type II toxin-antitoxin system RatA family toxin [Pararhodospirillum photometricum]CCG06905.1 Cyclase/dehydrase [Pararhodospirillum photometricum DSM 122]